MYPFLGIVPLIPYFDFYKWKSEQDKTLAEAMTAGVGTDDISDYYAKWREYIDLNIYYEQAGEPLTTLFEGDMASAFGITREAALACLDWWDYNIVPAFFNEFYDRYPCFESMDDFKRHINSYLRKNVWIILAKYQAAYNYVEPFSNGSESETIADTDTETTTNAKTGTSTTSANTTVTDEKLGYENNAPQHAIPQGTDQTYIDKWNKNTQSGGGTASSNGSATDNESGSRNRTYGRTRTIESTLGRAPIEYVETYYKKIQNLADDIINDLAKFFVGDMLYV